MCLLRVLTTYKWFNMTACWEMVPGNSVWEDIMEGKLHFSEVRFFFTKCLLSLDWGFQEFWKVETSAFESCNIAACMFFKKCWISCIVWKILATIHIIRNRHRNRYVSQTWQFCNGRKKAKSLTIEIESNFQCDSLLTSQFSFLKSILPFPP